jgi:hypothetical protein
MKRFRTIRAVGGPPRPSQGEIVAITAVPGWMRVLWAEEGRNPRTGLPMTEEDQKQIDENDGSIFDPAVKEDIDRWCSPNRPPA